MNIKLHFLGTSSGLPTMRRRSQTVVLDITQGGEVSHYLLDPGDGASSFLAEGLGHEHLQGVFITHMHVDHFIGLFQVIKTAWHLGRTEPLKVYLPEEGIGTIKQLLATSYLWEEMIFPIEFHSLKSMSGDVIIAPGFSMEVSSNGHLETYRQRSEDRGWPYHKMASFESYSLEFTHQYAEGLRWAYVGNLADEREVSRFSQCETIVTELAHMRPSVLFEEVAKLKVKSVIVAHYHMDWEDSPTALHALAAKVGCPVILTEDKDVVSLR